MGRTEKLPSWEIDMPQYADVCIIGQSGHGKSTLTSVITLLCAKIYGGDITDYETITNAKVNKSGCIEFKVAEVEYKANYFSASDQIKGKMIRQYDFPTLTDYIKYLLTQNKHYNCAILVVDATDGPTEETKEYVRLARVAGIRNIVTFISKIDLADDSEWLDLIEVETRKLLNEQGYNGDNTSVFRGSALKAEEAIKSGEFFDEICNPILELVNSIGSFLIRTFSLLKEPFLISIEDIYSIEKYIVVIGHIERGRLVIGEDVEIIGIKETSQATVIGIKMSFYDTFYAYLFDDCMVPNAEAIGLFFLCSEQSVECLQASESNKHPEDARILEKIMHNLDAMKQEEREAIKCVKEGNLLRGQVLAKPGTITAHRIFSCAIYVVTVEDGGYGTDVKNGDDYIFKIRTTSVSGVCKLPEDVKNVAPGEVAWIKVELEFPVAIETGLPFIFLREDKVIGIGRITKTVLGGSGNLLSRMRQLSIE